MAVEQESSRLRLCIFTPIADRCARLIMPAKDGLSLPDGPITRLIIDNTRTLDLSAKTLLRPAMVCQELHDALTLVCTSMYPKYPNKNLSVSSSMVCYCNHGTIVLGTCQGPQMPSLGPGLFL